MVILRETQLERQLRQHRRVRARVRLRQRIAAALSCLAVFCTTYAMILPAVTMTDSGAVSCGMAEHRHTDGCYEMRTEARYVCDPAIHTHSGDCYDEWGACVCGFGEDAGHIHTPDCVREENVRVLTCPLAEHTHGTDCLPPHSQPEPDLLCGCDYEHTHTADCVADGALICNLRAHTHTPLCRPSDPEADTETVEDWERSLASAVLTADWAENTVAIAETQLGYAESVRNYIVTDGGEIRGVSRYGQWAGQPYADWNALFVRFCLRYAGVDERTLPAVADAAHWEALLRTAGFDCYRAAGEYTPKRGDPVFFDDDGDGAADRTAIVYDLLADTLYTIEGDRDDAVRVAACGLDAPSLLAFCALPENPAAQAEESVPAQQPVMAAPPAPAAKPGDAHLPTVTTGEIGLRTSYLYNIDDSGEKMRPLAGVTYTVYAESGETVGFAVSTADYPLSLERLTAPDGSPVRLENGTTYRVAQTAVPAGYIPVPQTRSFTMTGAGAAVGMFFDYRAEAFMPQKTAEVRDEAARTFGITLTAHSGRYECTPATANLTLVVDRSGSMLFPAELIPLERNGEAVKLRLYREWSKNGQSLTDTLGTESDTLYYIVADVRQTATVYALWYERKSGEWFYQDVSTYARAYAGVSGFRYPESGKGWQGSGSVYGGVIDLRPEKDHMLTDMDGGAYYDYQVYVAGEYDRLTYLRDAVDQLIAQLVSLNSEGDALSVSLVTFCEEAAFAGTFNLSDPAQLRALRDAVSDITTGGGTRQDRALQTVVDRRLAGKDDTVVLITDGALTDRSGESRADECARAIRGTDDLNRSGDTGAKLICVGLSMENVEYGQRLLSRWATLDEAGNRWFYQVENTSELTRVLLEDVLSKVLRKELETQNATVRDEISGSFYPVDPKTNAPLPDGTRLAMDGSVYPETKWNGRRSVPNTDPCGTLRFDASTGRWYVEWVRHTLPVETDGEWRGTVFVKAREDFIGGSAIDTNAACTLHIEDETGLAADPEPYRLESPSVNVALLGMDRHCSEETVFLGDAVAPRERLAALLERVTFRKIASGSGSGMNRHDPSGTAEGPEADRFSLAYAGIGLTDSDWDTLLGADTDGRRPTVTKPYVYDDPSSHGAVGEFVFSVTKRGEGAEYRPHASAFAEGTETPAEVYTLNVKYVPYSSPLRPECRQNGRNGPGAAPVGEGQLAGTPKPPCAALESRSSHTVYAVEGSVTVRKTVDRALAENPPTDASVTFILQKMLPDGSFADFLLPGTQRVYTVTVPLPANAETASEAVFRHLPRGEYRVAEESRPDDFVPEGVSVIAEGTNCRADEPGQSFAVFHIGEDEAGADAIMRYDPAVSERCTLIYSIARDDAGTRGTAVFRNRAPAFTGPLPVRKLWYGGGDGSDGVYLLLCDTSGSPILRDGRPQAMLLTGADGWRGAFTVPLGSRGEDPTERYAVREAAPSPTGTEALLLNAAGEPVGTVKLGEAAENGEWLRVGGASYAVEYGQTDGELTVVNRLGGTLPDTGGGGLGRIFALGAGMAGLASAGWIVTERARLLRVRRRRKTE